MKKKALVIALAAFMALSLNACANDKETKSDNVPTIEAEGNNGTGIISQTPEPTKAEETTTPEPTKAEEAATPEPTKTAENDNPFGNEAGGFEGEVSSHSYKLALSGVEFTIPDYYSLMIVDDIGPVVYISDSFQMKLAVKEGSYEEFIKDKSAMTQKVIEAGGTVTQDVKETVIDGRNYVYFVCDLFGDKTLVVYTACTADTNVRVAGQIAMTAEDLTDEDMLNMFAEVTSKTVTTDKPDTVKDDLYEQERLWSLGEAKTESSLVVGNKQIIFNVPEGYYSNYVNNNGETFTSEDFLSADMIYWATVEWLGGDYLLDAKTYIEAEAEAANENYNAESAAEHIEVDGHDFYYAIMDYLNDGEPEHRFCAACSVGENMYIVTVRSYSEYNYIRLEDVIEFLKISE